jgi:hypothetical protein
VGLQLLPDVVKVVEMLKVVANFERRLKKNLENYFV